MKKHILSGLGALVLAAALAACGGSPGTSPTTAGPGGAASSSDAPASAAELKTADSTAGKIVVDKAGKSVYFFTKDVKDSGKSACEGACVAAWPAVTTTADAPSVEGVSGTIGTIPTKGRRLQRLLLVCPAAGRRP